MEIITSKDNEQIKLIRALHLKKHREEKGLFLAEGTKLVDESIEVGKVLNCLCMSESYYLENGGDYSSVYESFISVIEDKLFDSVSTMVKPEGILAILEINQGEDLSREKALMLDGIKDPGNLGTIIRSCEAFDFKDIILVNDCVDVYNPKTIRASMGSVFRVNILRADEELIKDYKEQGYSLISTDLGDSVEISKVNLQEKYILVIGSESHGVSQWVRDLSDFTVRIPMSEALDSLNAAIAASIAMYELTN